MMRGSITPVAGSHASIQLVLGRSGLSDLVAVSSVLLVQSKYTGASSARPKDENEIWEIVVAEPARQFLEARLGQRICASTACR
jgi:hypothetical protein